MTTKTNETQAYAAADAAVARAEATYSVGLGRAKTDAEFVAQWVAETEAAAACRAAAKFGPASFRAQYRADAELFEAWTA